MPSPASIARPVNSRFDVWARAVEANDTFAFARISGDRDLIRRLRGKLRDDGADPLGRDMLALADLENGINRLVEKARKYDELETILNDTSAPDRRVIERLSEVFFG
jgi:hypothetical protein